MLSIIGTAGRKEDGKIISTLHFEKMCDVSRFTLGEWKQTELVSGGAAWADHVAVKLYLNGDVKNLVLHLPAEFDVSKKAFVPLNDHYMDPGNIANYYHGLFFKKTKINSLDEISQAIKKGAKVVVTPGMIPRNKKVAQDSDYMIAFTFGDGEIIADYNTSSTAKESLLADGGTAKTWDSCKSAQIKRHVNLFKILDWTPKCVVKTTENDNNSSKTQLTLF